MVSLSLTSGILHDQAGRFFPQAASFLASPPFPPSLLALRLHPYSQESISSSFASSSVFWEPKICQRWMALGARQGLAQSKDTQETMNSLTLKRKPDAADPWMRAEWGPESLETKTRTLPLLCCRCQCACGKTTQCPGDLPSLKGTEGTSLLLV